MMWRTSEKNASSLIHVGYEIATRESISENIYKSYYFEKKSTIRTVMYTYIHTILFYQVYCFIQEAQGYNFYHFDNASAHLKHHGLH